MSIKLIKLEKEKEELFIELTQAAFQKGFEDYFGKTDQIIIPRKDILDSLYAEGSNSFLAIQDDKVVGGVCVVINKTTNENDLHILFVNAEFQSKGIGFRIWNEIEKIYPDTKTWRTCTPYFDKRNVHFYLNKCKFHIVKYQKDNYPEDFIGDGGLGMFEFEKEIN